MAILYITYRIGTLAFKKFYQDIALLVTVLIFSVFFSIWFIRQSR